MYSLVEMHFEFASTREASAAKWKPILKAKSSLSLLEWESSMTWWWSSSAIALLWIIRIKTIIVLLSHIYKIGSC